MNPWNSLEIVKLVASLLTPIAVAVVGLWINRRLKKFEQLQWANQKVVEKRLVVFDQIAPLLNDLLCYFTYVGCWKDLTPPDVVKLKRGLDRIAYVNAPLFPRAFLDRYNAFIGLCYRPFAGWTQDAKLRTPTERRKEAAGTSWKAEWDSCFAELSECYDPKKVQGAYSELVSYLACELGVGIQLESVPVGKIPFNIR